MFTDTPATRMYRTHLTRATLARFLKGLALSTDERASVLRACRKLSKTGTFSSCSFSGYNPGVAPTMASLENVLENRANPDYDALTYRERRGCRTFLILRAEAGAPPEPSYRPLKSNGKGCLHNWGPLNPTQHVPSTRRNYQ